MADENFNIKVVTTADTRGIQQTSAELNKLKQQEASAASESAAGFGRSAVGIGTIIALVTGAISKWKEFNAEQDRWVEGMIKAEEKARALGEAILDIQDKARNAARIGTEPLYQSFIRLQQEIIRLKTEQNLLDLPGQGEEWKKLSQDIAIAQSQLKGVTAELNKQKNAAAELAQKNAQAQASFMKGALGSASPQVQATIKAENEARKAREAGEGNLADRLQKNAESFKRGMTPDQLAEYEGLTKPVRLGRKAGIGESQEILDDISRNKINFERQLKGEPPLPEGNASGNSDLIQAINDLKNELLGIWR